MIGFIFPVFFAILLCYYYTKMKLDIKRLYDPKHEVINTNGHMKIWTLNTLVFDKFGHFRDNGDTYVTYQYITAFFLPLIPIGAYRIKEYNDGKYSVLGSVKPFSLEILSTYILWFGWPLLLLSLCIAFNM